MKLCNNRLIFRNIVKVGIDVSMRLPSQATGKQLITWLQNVTKYFQKSCWILTKTWRWVVQTNWQQLKMPGERNIYRMKRKGEILFSVDENKPLPEILNCTRSLAWAATWAGHRRRSVMAIVSNVDSFMLNCFRWPPGSICVKEVSGGLSPSSAEKTCRWMSLSN